MRKYQIKDLERLSGIKAHTIRIWEQRYNLLTPERTETNIRYYKDDDVRKILNVSLLLQKGYKISNVCSLDDDQLNLEVKENLESTTTGSEGREAFITGLTLSMIELDESKFNQVYQKSVHEVGFQQTIMGLIYPFLLKIGVMYGVNEINPAQEHFISNLIRQKMITAINDIESSISKDKSFVLYLSQNELHEIGLIMAHYMLKSKGYKVIYLGQDVPFFDVASVVACAKPSHVMTILTAVKTIDELQQLVDNSLMHLGQSELVFSGLGAYSHILNVDDARITLLNSAADFENYLK